MNEETLKPGWTKVRFGEVVRLCTERSSNPEADGIERYVGLEHLEPDDLRVRRWGLVADGTTFTSRFKPGQVLFGKRRAYQRKVAVADFEGVCSGDIYVFESANSKYLLPDLLPFICQTEQFFEYAIGTSAGSLSPRTNWKSLKDFEFSLPLIDEQQQIINALNTFEETLQAHQFLCESAKLLLRSALDGAFHLDSKRKLTDNNLPEGWKLVCLKEITDRERTISYGILKPGDPDSKGIPMLRVMDFDEFGRRTDTEVVKVSQKVSDTSKTTILQSGDLVVSVMATVGRSFVVEPEMNGWNLNRALTVIPFNNLSTAEYIDAFFQSGFMQRFFDVEKIGSAQARINLSALKEVNIPVAPSCDWSYILNIRKAQKKSLTSSEMRLKKATLLKAEFLRKYLMR